MFSWLRVIQISSRLFQFFFWIFVPFWAHTPSWKNDDPWEIAVLVRCHDLTINALTFMKTTFSRQFIANFLLPHSYSFIYVIFLLIVLEWKKLPYKAITHNQNGIPYSCYSLNYLEHATYVWRNTQFSGLNSQIILYTFHSKVIAHEKMSHNTKHTTTVNSLLTIIIKTVLTKEHFWSLKTSIVCYFVD